MEPMRKVQVGFVLGLASCAAAASAAAELPGVAPVPSVDGAAFAMEGSRGEAHGDGARLVACGSVLVSATDGSRASVSCADGVRLDLASGAFHVLVGSKGAAIRIGRTALRATSARIWAARVGDRWLVRFERDGDVGSAEIAADEAAAAPADGVAPAPNALSSQEVHVFEGPAPAAEPADAASIAAFRDVAARLAPREEPGKALVPRRVESADDFKAGTTAAAAGGGEIELEAIEVEAGCIEVCVD
jgi:hypothetical protein